MLFRVAIGSAILLLVWLFASRAISLQLDRVTTARVTTLAAQTFRYDGGGLRIGEVDLTLAGFDNLRTDVAFRTDVSNRLHLMSGGRSFPLGPRLSVPDPSGRPEIEFAPDAGDVVTLTLDHSWLARPTFFDIKIMTRTAWFRRHAYYRVTWRKLSGETLIEWACGPFCRTGSPPVPVC